MIIFLLLVQKLQFAIFNHASSSIFIFSWDNDDLDIYFYKFLLLCMCGVQSV